MRNLDDSKVFHHLKEMSKISDLVEIIAEELLFKNTNLAHCLMAVNTAENIVVRGWPGNNLSFIRILANGNNEKAIDVVDVARTDMCIDYNLYEEERNDTHI